MYKSTTGRLQKAMLYGIAILVLLILGVSILLLATVSTHTPLIVDPGGDKLPDSIAEERMLTLGGTEQYVLIRGANRSAPLLVYVHGGPGMTATPFLRTYNADLEKEFLVVYWEQRGTSNSYSEGLDPERMSIDQITQDLSELVSVLTAEFNQEKILLIGHSWGTIPALAYAAASPDTVAAYVSVSQTVNQIESDTIGYEWALAEAERKAYSKSVRALEQIGAPPYTIDEFVIQRRQVNFLGGSMLNTKSDLQMAWMALNTPEFAWPNLGPLVDGVQFSGSALWDEQQTYDAFTAQPTLEVPLFMLFGRHDRVISFDLGREYFDFVDAPRKEFIWFEHSAHAPQFEEPEVFNATIVAIAKDVGFME
jgi:pimeloyl-ACP methyl ester carboxylesterase